MPAKLWHLIQDRLDASKAADWKQRIADYRTIEAVQRRERGGRWRDEDVLGAMVLAVLSNSADWSRIHAVRPLLPEAFEDYSLKRCAERTERQVERCLGRLNELGVSSQTLRRGLRRLTLAARRLHEWSTTHGSADSYFLSLLDSCQHDPKQAALALGANGSDYKLPGLGIALAAETLRNLGYDLSKPDRHVCRAAGAFGLVAFRRWPNRRGTKAPEANPRELLDTMMGVEEMARAVGVQATYLDTAIWILCARSGAHLKNADLEALAAKAQVP